MKNGERKKWAKWGRESTSPLFFRSPFFELCPTLRERLDAQVDKLLNGSRFNSDGQFIFGKHLRPW